MAVIDFRGAGALSAPAVLGFNEYYSDYSSFDVTYTVLSATTTSIVLTFEDPSSSSYGWISTLYLTGSFDLSKGSATITGATATESYKGSSETEFVASGLALALQIFIHCMPLLVATLCRVM
jgi:hypothetical protein